MNFVAQPSCHELGLPAGVELKKLQAKHVDLCSREKNAAELDFVLAVGANI